MKKRTTIRDLSQKPARPIVALTAYTAPFARILDPHADLLLVGDSLGMVLYGMESTLPVSLDMMIAHGQAVAKASQQACVIVDMPFGSYQASPSQAYLSAARIMAETNCQGVKLEGGVEMADTVRFLTERAIPVMGHVGLMPQHVHQMGGFKTQGRSKAQREAILRDARAIEQAGAFAIVLEGITESLAIEITKALSIPTIGIGASVQCDGQILVSEDMAGLMARTPRFVKTYGALADMLNQSAEAYANDVRNRAFPAAEHCTQDE